MMMMMRQVGEARKVKLDLLEKEEEERGLFFRHSNHIANHIKKEGRIRISRSLSTALDPSSSSSSQESSRIIQSLRRVSLSLSLSIFTLGRRTV